MSDFNGRIGAIARAFKDDPLDIVSARMTIRDVLRAERADGWQEGHSDGLEDQYQGNRVTQQRLAKEHETFVGHLIGRAPAEWSGEGTPEQILTGYLRALEAAFENAHGRLPVPADYEPPTDSTEGET
jgi:hypothetical protein